MSIIKCNCWRFFILRSLRSLVNKTDPSVCISVLAGIIVLTSFWCIHAQTLDLPAPLNDTLGNWYNLGRVSGSKTYTNCLVPYFNDGFALIDLYHYSSGNTHIETGISALSLFGSFGNSGAFLVMLPGIDLTLLQHHHRETVCPLQSLPPI